MFDAVQQYKKCWMAMWVVISMSSILWSDCISDTRRAYESGVDVSGHSR